MTANTMERPAPEQDERLYYAQLWGNLNGPARTRETWRTLRARSALLAVAAGALLLGYVAVQPFWDNGAAADTAPPAPAEAPLD